MPGPVMSATLPSTGATFGTDTAADVVVSRRRAGTGAFVAVRAPSRFHRYNVERLTPVSAAIAATFSPDRSRRSI
jgi:hypothetical protein